MATITDSRRLTGPNLLSDRPGAILDLSLAPGDEVQVVAAWRESARRILNAVEWNAEHLYTRTFPGGASLVLTAPIDALYAATEVNEWAWEAAEASLLERESPSLADATRRLLELIKRERNPRLIRLEQAAVEHQVAFLSDDRAASVGLGSGSFTWPIDQLPDVDTIPWDKVHDVPVALVTGCNGKTTTVRLVAAMIEAAGHVPGLTSTDAISVGRETIDRGDWAGPGGARMMLRDTRVERAVLETARGGILRRGLAVHRANVALVTNIAEDHLGEFGVHDLRSLAETKMVVARVVAPNGRVVLNADDPALRAEGSAVAAPVTWFTLDAALPFVRTHVAGGGDAVYEAEGAVVLDQAGKATIVERVERIPLTLDGLARYNVANVLGAIGVAAGLGIPLESIAAALREFRPSSEDNPGRLNVFDLSGARVILDFAHNPHGVAAVVSMAAALPAERRLVLIGQAGDRDDESIRGLARAAWGAHPDRIVIKELARHLRGRAPGEVPAILAEEFLRLGASKDRLVVVDSEMAGVREALAWARTGDLILLPVQGDRDETLRLLRQLEKSRWKPGEDLPA
ncbi:MAG: Mur ligase [Gemmatimonadales bacterium]|nr:Mur ligase [Gemmatimonadales bacterium]